MRVDRHGQLPESGVEHHVGGFSADARQRFEFFAGLRDFAVMTLDQQAASLDDILGFAVIEADGLDVLRQTLDTQCVNRRRRVGHRKQFGRRLVDPDVGRCAERITAINSSKGEEYASSVFGSGLSSWSLRKISRRFAAFMGEAIP